MPQLFHPSTNTISKLTIFGALFAIGGLLFVGAAVYRSAYVTGAYAPPTRAAMEEEIRVFEAEIRRRYFHTERHALEVEQGPYVSSVNAELQRGIERAARLSAGGARGAVPKHVAGGTTSRP